MPDDLTIKAMMFIIVILSITVHEFAHAKSAQLAGDPTAKMMGRVTLNPIAHFDPFGIIMIIMTTFAGFGFGWGKPVPIDPSRMHNPKWDAMLVAAWGPFSNLLIALACAIALRFFLPIHAAPMLSLFLFFSLMINVWLCCFNLIPLHPLDGSKILGAFLPPQAAMRYWRWNIMYGPLIFLGCIFLLPMFGIHPISQLLMPVVTRIQAILLPGFG